MNILVLNAGSSSQKSCLYRFEKDASADSSGEGAGQLPEPVWEAQIDWLPAESAARLAVHTRAGKVLEETVESPSRSDTIAYLLSLLCARRSKISALAPVPSNCSTLEHPSQSAKVMGTGRQNQNRTAIV
ncbi:MAG: hypothetical protein WBC73_13920, partial [Phormidesmis sp.]